jgi:hypothetical protein
MAIAAHQGRKSGDFEAAELAAKKYGALPEQQHICGLDRTSFGPKDAT